MANDNNHWVDERLKTLEPRENFQPGPARARARLRERTQTSPRSSRWMWATAALSMCLAIAAMPAPRAVAQRAWERLFVVEVTSQPAPAPDFALAGADGDTVTLSSYQRKVVLLNFWATWCVPCRQEIPWFIELQEAYADRGFAVLGVAVDEGGWDVVRPFIEEREVNYPVMLGELNELPEPYRSIGALPVTFLIDTEGRIVGRHDSLASKADYERWILEQLR